MSAIKISLLFSFFFINYLCGTSQIPLTKEDSILKNEIFYRKRKIEYLENELINVKEASEKNKQKIDSIEKLSLILIDKMDYYKVLIELNIQSEENKNFVKPGFYFRESQKLSVEDSLNNEIEWIYISDSLQVKIFITSKNNSCNLGFKSKNSPQKMYNKINRNRRKFNSSYLTCNKSDFYPSVNYIFGVIIFKNENSTTYLKDVITFSESGIIRTFMNENNDVLVNKYTFIGK